MLYQVFLIEYHGGGKREHHAIFVEMNTMDGSGDMYHVIGDIQRGMDYEHRQLYKPENSLTFKTKSSIGWMLELTVVSTESVAVSRPPKSSTTSARDYIPKSP